MDPAHRSGRRVAALAGGLTIGWASVLQWVRIDAPGVPVVDSDVHAWALDHRTEATIRLARELSWLGQVDVVLPLIIVAAVAVAAGTGAFGRPRAAALLLGLGGLGIAVGLGINRLAARARPPVGDWASAAGGFAFPSGHTTAATVAAGLVAWTVSRRLSSRPVRAAVWVVASGWALGVGWSRVWLGVHWPTDVLGGWLFAASFLLAARAVHITWWPDGARPDPVAGQRPPSPMDAAIGPAD